jgi:hypothetical protein
MFGLAILAAVAYSFWRWQRNKEPGLWTPERAALYRSAMRFEHIPEKLLKLAAYYEKEGFPDKSKNLMARAELATHHQRMAEYGVADPRMATILDATDLRNRIMRRALTSQNPVAIEEVAASFEGEGCGASAEVLRDIAHGLEVAQRLPLTPPGAAFGIGTIIPSVYQPPPPPKVQAVDQDGKPIFDDNGNPVYVSGDVAMNGGMAVGGDVNPVGDSIAADGGSFGTDYGHRVPAGG